ncbi:hypothetical protein T484DRAFT_1838274 [Baffinella frigidus]|nr:hypothetical protein T484DRAFT_1838274 [Cryptophyta sp. CCMP2293]
MDKEEDQGSEPDEDDTGDMVLDKATMRLDMVLDKATMRLVPRGQEGKGGLDADLKKKQMEVAARMKKMKEANDAKQAAARGPVPGEEDLTAEDRAWMEANGMMGIVGEADGAGAAGVGGRGKGGAGVGAGGKGAGGARGKKATEEEMRKKTVSFGVNEEQTFEAPSPDVTNQTFEAPSPDHFTGPGAAFAAAAAAKLSKREQYRVAVMQAKEELEEDKAALNMEEGGSRASNTEAPPGGVSHAGVLRKKKQDHGRFEDPYRQTFVADLEDGILTLRLTKDGEVTGEEESYNLGEGWKLTAREDKKDRFTLVRSGPKMDSADPDEAGVGMVLKQTQGTLVVKKMTDGAPAAASEQIEVGDVLLKVDGKKVSTAEQAAQLILGDVGSSVSLLVERDIEGRKEGTVSLLIERDIEGCKVKFPLTLKRGKPPGK